MSESRIQEQLQFNEISLLVSNQNQGTIKDCNIHTKITEALSHRSWKLLLINIKLDIDTSSLDSVQKQEQ